MQVKGFRIIAVAVFAAVTWLTPVTAQQTTTGKSVPQPKPQNPWAIQCRSEARNAPLFCSMEQRLLLRQTRQQVAKLTIQVSGKESKTPVVLVQLPHGLSIPEGIAIQVDDQEAAKFGIRTCDAAGCYASGELTSDLLASFKRGKQARISFANLQRKVIRVSFSLADFTTSYGRIE